MNNTVKMTDALLEDYELQEEVSGKGSYGVVRRCFNKQTGQEAACKTIRKSDILIHPSIDKERCYNEIRTMQRVSGHPAVVSLHAAYEE